MSIKAKIIHNDSNSLCARVYRLELPIALKLTTYIRV